MASCSMISFCNWSHFNSSLYRHLGKSRVVIWRTLLHQACFARFNTRQTSPVESSLVLSRHFSTLNKHSLRFVRRGEREGVLIINNCGLHFSRTCLLENAVNVTQQTNEDLNTEIRKVKESAENVSFDENSSGEEEKIPISQDDTSMRTNCSELNDLSVADTEPSCEETCSNEESSSQTSVPLTAEMLEKFLMNFFGNKQVKKAARENGLSNTLFKEIFLKFKNKINLQVEDGNKEMLEQFSSLYYNADYMQQLFPLFMKFAQKVHPMLKSLEEVKKISDLRGPADLFPEARAMKRKIIFHAGPTNSGKTHAAIERFHAANSGVYCGPLRLLAAEVFKRANHAGVPCDLVTGEDRQWAVSPDDPSDHISCTVEMCSSQRPFDCAVIDEIQMMRDTDRGWAWSRALLGLPCPEIHVCGESSAINLVERLVSSCNDELEVRHYERLCPLEVSQRSLGGNFQKIRAGDCVVAFSQWDLYQVRRKIESQTNKKCAIIYGGLPPVTKLEQAMKFNDPEDDCSVLVASDAIGMGLNLNIKRIVFSSLLKYNGNNMVQLTSSQVKQIAGRAGRFGSAHSKGEVTTVRGHDSKTLQRLMEEPIKDVKAAGLSPSMEQIEMLAQHLPDASLLKLYETFESVVQLDGANYFMCDLADVKILARKLGGIPLSISDQFVFSRAPISVKKSVAVDLAVKFAECVSADSPITASKLETFLKWPPQAPRTLEQLKNLETLHEGLDLYLWLSYRYPQIFVDQQNVCNMQDDVEAIIGDTVSSSSFGGSSITLPSRRRRSKARFGDKNLIKWMSYHKF